MEAVDIKGRTRAIGAPANWDQHLDGTCGVLCVRDEVDVQSGHKMMVSAWKPDPIEIAALNNGAPILLHVFGQIHPVVAVGVGSPHDMVASIEGEA